MKAKVKFDKSQLKPLLVQHVEKIVFVGMALAALLLCWSAIGLSPYAGTPDQLKKKADDVKARVASSTPPEKFDDLPAKRNLSGMLASALIEVNPGLFPMSEISRPYSDRKVRREQPVLLALQDLRATAGFGAIAISEHAMGRDRLAVGRNPARSPMSMMGGGGMTGAGMMGDMADMPGAAGGSGMPGMDPSQMQGMQGMQDMMRRRGGGGMDTEAMPGRMEDMMSGMMDQVSQMRPGARDNNKKKKPKRPAPKPKAKPEFEVEKPALDVPANAKLEGRYWVTVTGLIPSWDQESEFQKVFRDATKTLPTDTPEYVFCDVERADVLSPGQVGEFEPLDMELVEKDQDTWAAVYPEMIDKKYLTPSIDVTEPLPPLVHANHDPNAIRHPKIPLAGEASAEENKAAAKAAEAVKEDAEGGAKGRSRKRAGRGRSAGPKGMGGMGGMMPMGGMGGMMGMSGRMGVAKEKIDYMLFRFFDFTVTPGKKYKYRVRLALENPNFDVAPQYLKSADLAKEEFVYTDWSEPSPEVFVPLGSELLAGDINPKDPSGKILVRQFDKDKAVTAAHEFELARGATMNAEGVEVPMPNTTPGATPGSSEEKQKVDFRTDATMIDLVGGDKLTGGPMGTKSPGRMLVLRSDGELALLSEFDDARRYEIAKYKLDEAANGDKAKTPGGAKEADEQPQPGGANAFSDFFNDDEPKKKKGGRK